MKKRLLSLFLLLTLATLGMGQGSATYQGGLKVKLNDDGSKYVRFLTWHQMWVTLNQPKEGSLEMNYLLRRSRVLMFAQLSKRFLILTHFGLNSMNTASMGALSPSSPQDPNPGAGRGFNGQFFMHDAWVDYTIIPKVLHIGGGLHYWNGVTRMASASTLNFLTLDAPLLNWFSLGTTDQFARHLGLFAKGKIGRIDYRLALNEALTRPILGQNPLAEGETTTYYNFQRPGGGKVASGYFCYEFLDRESNLLPYFVGTYMGEKKIFNIGAGFYNHFNGTSTRTVAGDTVLNDALSLGADVFYETPLGSNGSAFSLYGSYYYHNWGTNFKGALGGVGTGNIVYGHIAYVLPNFWEKMRIQPYFSYATRNLEANQNFDRPIHNNYGLGANFFLEGHHAKFTLEYRRNMNAGSPAPAGTGSLVLQAMIYL